VGPVNQPGNSFGLIALQSQIHRRARHPCQRRDLLFQVAFRVPQHDPSSRRYRRRHIRTFYQSLQLGLLVYSQLNLSIEHQAV
jgi:hypothetical protein